MKKPGASVIEARFRPVTQVALMESSGHAPHEPARGNAATLLSVAQPER